MNHTEFESTSQILDIVEKLRIAKINRQDGVKQEIILEQIPLSDLLIICQLERLSDTLATVEQHLDCLAKNTKKV